jgi:RNase P subunit RPR2
MQLLTLIISVILLCFGLSFVFWRKKTPDSTKASPPNPLRRTNPHPERSDMDKKIVFCPLCSTALTQGERVKSIAFPSLKSERIMHIKGCPHCLDGEKTRFCPVCNAILRKDEILTARMTAAAGKTSVKIFGCSRCGGKAAELR